MTAISIEPPGKAVDTRCVPPGSKSHTIRALFAASAAKGDSTLVGPLDSEDTRRARECLRALGVVVEEGPKAWRVTGVGGEYSAPGDALDAGESGLTARFLMGLAPHIPGKIAIIGRGRLPKRPMAGILASLERRGASVSDGYPWVIDASNAAKSGKMRIDASESSQMVSALLIPAPLAAGVTEIEVSGLRSSHEYIAVTVDVLRAFGAMVEVTASGFTVSPGGYEPTVYRVPVDASSSVYPACAAAISGGRIEIIGNLGAHPDRRIFSALEAMGCTVEATAEGNTVSRDGDLTSIDIDMASAPDAAVGLAVTCAVASGESRIGGLESLRHKESDRLKALEVELRRFGAEARIEGDTLIIDPRERLSARFGTHNDHRIAMSLGLLGLVAEVTIEEPQVVDKTWPGYWVWLESTGVAIHQI